MAYDSPRMGDPYPQIDVLDFVRLMRDFLEKRINAEQYQRAYFDLNTKRIVLSEEESKTCNRPMVTQTILTRLSIYPTRLMKNS